MHSAQNVGKVWMSRNKNILTLFHATSGYFPMDRTNAKNVNVLPISLGGPMAAICQVWDLAAIHPWWGNKYYTAQTLNTLPTGCAQCRS